MSFKLISTISTGSYQSLFSRIIENPSTIDLTSSLPGTGSTKSIPFDGLNDTIDLGSAIYTGDIGTSGASATNLALEAWIQHSITGATRSTFFDTTIRRSICADTSGYDGFYTASIILTGNKHFIEFRYDKDSNLSYVLTSNTASPLVASAWNHVFLQYLSASQLMQIYINGVLDTSSAISQVTTGTPLGARGVSFGGRLDELRLWINSAAATSISQIASSSGIGKAAEQLNNINELTPSSTWMAAWWKFESVSAFQLFSSISASITDSTGNGHDGTPSGFQGSDVISSEVTIINGISASGDLMSLQGGTLDHGGLTVIDPSDNTARLEWGVENLIKNEYNTWSNTGTNVTISVDNNNIFYGASGVRVKTVSADTGIYQLISNSALLFANNTYTCSLRYRSISGSTSGRLTFTLGNSASSITAVTNTSVWQPIVIRNTVGGTTMSGRIDFIQLNSQNNEGALFQIDGLMVNENDYFPAFIAPGRIRKSSQMYYQLLD